MKQAPTVDRPAEGVDALRALIVAGEQLRHAVAAHFGIGASETAALSHLRLHDELSPRELAERIGLTPSTVTSLLDRLEAVGFVRRSAHPTDRRMTVVTLSEPGEEVLARADEWLGAAIDRLGREAIPDLAAVLSRLAAGLEEQANEISSLPPAPVGLTVGGTKRSPGPALDGAPDRSSPGGRDLPSKRRA